MQNPLMECGHAANAVGLNGPVCIICMGVKPGAHTVAVVQPDLSNRVAACSGCSKEVPSTTPKLAFFCHQPTFPKDSYYCGCFGWD